MFRSQQVKIICTVSLKNTVLNNFEVIVIINEFSPSLLFGTWLNVFVWCGLHKKNQNQKKKSEGEVRQSAMRALWPAELARFQCEKIISPVEWSEWGSFVVLMFKKNGQVDFFSMSNILHHFVIVHGFISFRVSSTSAQSTILKLLRVFSQFGLPYELVSERSTLQWCGI